MGKLQSPLPKKYHFRYEQLIQYLFLAGEVPTNLYEFMGISNSNYRKLFSKLRSSNIIRTVRSGGLCGYTLTANGKERLSKNKNYARYTGYTEATTSDANKRRRMQNYAAAYSVFDYAGVVYEPYIIPDINEIITNSSTIYFHSSKDFKREEDKSGTNFKGGRSYGFLAGKNEIYPIYIAHKSLPEFSNREFKYINHLRIKYTHGGGIRQGLLFCKDILAVKQIAKEYMSFETEQRGRSLTESGYFDDIYLLPMTEHFVLQLWSLYNADKIRNDVIGRYNIEPKTSYIVNDGFINETEPVLFLINFAAARLKLFLSANKGSNVKGHIVCYDYMYDVICSLLDGSNNINIIKINSAALEANIKSV